MTRPHLAALLTACSAVAVTAAGMVFAWNLRPPSPDDTAPSTARDDLRCGTEVCRSVASAEVGADTVEVLYGQDSGRIRTTGAAGRTVFELTIAESGAEITGKSLQCVDGDVGVCLVRGPVGSKTLGEVLVRRSGAWSRAQVPYVSSGAYLALHDVDGDSVADVVAVQRDCAAGEECPRRFAQVFSLTAELGCTEVVAGAEQLPGWPTVTPDRDELHRCGT